MTNLDSIFKSRDITLSTKVRLVKAMVFPVVMYGCESWTIKKAEYNYVKFKNKIKFKKKKKKKKAERRRIDAFELWCWRRLLGLQGDPTCPPKGDQSWVFIGRTDVEAETPILWPPHARS